MGHQYSAKTVIQNQVRVPNTLDGGSLAQLPAPLTSALTIYWGSEVVQDFQHPPLVYLHGGCPQVEDESGATRGTGKGQLPYKGPRTQIVWF